MPRGKAERSRARAARPEVAPVDEDGGARRLGRDLEDRDVRLDLVERGLDARSGLRIALALEGLCIVTERGGVFLQLLVAAGNVESHVAVRHESIRREKVLEGALVVALAVARGADLKLEVGLVGE